MPSSSPNPDAANARFHTTRWSMVLSLGEEGEGDTSAALCELCTQYWYPVYAFARRQGSDASEAGDLTQAFFCHVLQRNIFSEATPERGKFRTFVLACFKNFQQNEHRRETAEKRGGGKQIFSIDARLGESRYQQEPTHDETPEKLFERRWAMTLLDNALAQLDAEFACSGKRELYEALKPFLSGTSDSSCYREIGEVHYMSQTAIKVTMHRLRRRYRELLRDEVRQTVVGTDDVEEELLRLFEAFA
jgi:RNA polymerase sigma factor (sigma-70 family)